MPTADIESPQQNSYESLKPATSSRRIESLVPDRDEFMTLEEAAVAAGVSVRTLARYRAAGILEVTRVGRRVYCTLSAVRAALVRPSLEDVGRAVLHPPRNRWLNHWWLDAIRLAEAHPAFESPERLRMLAAASQRLFPALKADELTCAQFMALDEQVGDSSPESASEPSLARIINVFPPDAPMTAALVHLRGRFGW